MRSNSFFREVLRGKFTGTSAYLALTNAHPQTAITYAVLLESPKLDTALKLHANDRMRQLIRPNAGWALPIGVIVLDLAAWNALYPEYPAQPL